MSSTPPKIIPMPTDPYAEFQWHMVRAHATFKTGLGRIIGLLKEPPKDDMYNFLGYAEAWALAIVNHHDTEERAVFPFLNTKTNMAEEIEDHKAIHDGLDKFLASVRAGKMSPESFDCDAALGIIEGMKAVLISHLDAEVEHISPANMKSAGFTVPEIKKMLSTLFAEAKKDGDPFLIIPFMVSHTPPEHKSFPDAPWFLKKVLIPYVFAMRYSGYWKYSPYAMS